MGTHFTFDVHMDLDEEVDGEDVGEVCQTGGGEIRGRATTIEVSVLKAIGGSEDEGGGDGEEAYAVTSPALGSSAAPARRRKGWRVAWKTRGMPGMLLRSERVQDFLEAEDGDGTDYVCWETFYGFIAPILRLAIGAKLERGFGTWMDDLKSRAESLEGKRGEGEGVKQGDE